MRSQRSWSGAEQHRLETLLNQGLSNRAIAKALNRTTYSVQKRLFELKMRRRPIPEAVNFTIRIEGAVYDELSALAQRLGMSKSFFVRSAIKAKMENSK